MRRPHDPDPQRIAGNGIGPEGIAAGDLGNAVDPRDPSPYRPAGLGHRRCGGCCYRENGIHDLAVAGTAAEHTAQGIFDFGSCRSRRATDEFGGRHQHARRTDATLRRAVCQKGCLQSRQRLASLRDRRSRDLRPSRPAGRRPGPSRRGRNRSGGCRAARYRPRNRRRRSRPWCRDSRDRRAAPRPDVSSAPPPSGRSRRSGRKPPSCDQPLQ
jgi:hypothetical protein